MYELFELQHVFTFFLGNTLGQMSSPDANTSSNQAEVLGSANNSDFDHAADEDERQETDEDERQETDENQPFCAKSASYQPSHQTPDHGNYIQVSYQRSSKHG